MNMPIWGEPADVYRAYAADGTALYIGMTGNLERRLFEHQRRAPWWSRVRKIRIEHFDKRYHAITAEEAAIAEENPAFNQRGRRVICTCPCPCTGECEEAKTLARRGSAS